MKVDDFVIATQPINGIVVNSVGIINSICEKGVQVYFIGRNEVVIAPFNSLQVINIGETGEEYSVKICNVCHILKSKEEFDRNQTNASGRPTTRPSCKNCRKVIDGEKMPTSERRRMSARRLSDQTVFICPICEKRTIVDVTAKIVADHNHDTGEGREWICDSCNTGLGGFKDNIAILETAIEYLKRFEDDEPEDADSK